MAYDYRVERKRLFTEDGQIALLSVRDATRELIKKAGACSMGAIIGNSNAGDTWLAMACVDRLIEIKELDEIHQPGHVHGQDRVFVAPPGWR